MNYSRTMADIRQTIFKMKIELQMNKRNQEGVVLNEILLSIFIMKQIYETK